LPVVTTEGSTAISTGGHMALASFADGGVLGSTFSKLGSGMLTMSNSVEGNVSAANTIFKVEEGTLALSGADPFGGSRSVELAGGTLDVATDAGVPLSTDGLVAHWAFEEPTDLGLDSIDGFRERLETGIVQ
jgi:hypothetical protein